MEKTRNFACEGLLCNPPLGKYTDPDGYINTCVANLIEGYWHVPNDWKVIKNMPYCPRCKDLSSINN